MLGAPHRTKTQRFMGETARVKESGRQDKRDWS